MAKTSTSAWTDENPGTQLDCVDKRNYDQPYVTKGEIV